MDFDLNSISDELIKKAEQAEELQDISNDISKSYLWVLCCLGIPGNIFTAITIYTMSKTTTATFFVALLAVCDGLALVTKLIGNQMSLHEVGQGDAFCKLQMIPMFLSTMANWALALIAFERFVSVCYPLKKLYLFTKKRSYIITAIIFVTLLTIFAVVIGVMYKAGKTVTKCGTKTTDTEFFIKGWYWINASLFLFLPFCFNMVFTLLIIRGLVMSRKERRSIMVKDDKGMKGKAMDNNRRLILETERAERMITIMLILASIIFLILALPAVVFLFADRESEDLIIKARWGLFEQIQYVCLDSTHAINFFLYFISAKRFRNHFISILTCKLCCHKANNSRFYSYSSSNNTDSSKLSNTSTVHAGDHALHRVDDNETST